jgi:hypothetical protein
MPFQPLAHYQILTAMLAPALFMTATASLILSANTRLARVVDRMRALLAELENSGPPELEGIERQIARHRRRSRIILRAGRLLYLALSAFVATSLAIALDSFAGFSLGQIPTALSLFGVSLVLVACLFLSRETGMAVDALDDEFEQAEAARKRRAE